MHGVEYIEKLHNWTQCKATQLSANDKQIMLKDFHFPTIKQGSSYNGG